MKVKKKIIQGTALFLAFVVSIIIVFSGAVFADEAYTDEYGNYVECWNFRNAQDNNAVTGRPTPTNDKEAWGKWAAKYGTGWAAAPTPPIIVNEKLYIGVDAQILEIDKDTGEVLRRSEEMPGNVGWRGQRITLLSSVGRQFLRSVTRRSMAQVTFIQVPGQRMEVI